MKKKTAGLMFAGAGVVFLLHDAIHYLGGTPTASPFGPIGIALVVIGAAIVKSGRKDETQEPR